jgi:hypothetical protein
MTMYQIIPDLDGQPAQCIKRIADNAFIPFDSANTDYQEYLAWLAGGNTPDPAPVPAPEEALAAERAAMRCTPAQMRLTLHRMDLLTQVQAIADADEEARIVWEYATVIERTSPLIDALGGPNGFTDTQIDDIFRAAMQV